MRMKQFLPVAKKRALLDCNVIMVFPPLLGCECGGLHVLARGLQEGPEAGVLQPKSSHHHPALLTLLLPGPLPPALGGLPVPHARLPDLGRHHGNVSSVHDNS